MNSASPTPTTGAGSGRAGRFVPFRAWLGFVFVGLIAVLVYEFLPATGWPKDSLYYNVLALSAVGAIVVGIRVNDAADALPWFLFAAGELVFVLGDVIFSVYQHVSHSATLNEVSQVIYLVGYPLIAAGLLLLIRQRSPGRDWSSLIDALIIATAPGILIWLFLMQPYIGGNLDLSTVLAFCYPLMDIVLLGVAARLFISPGTKPGAFWLLGASLGLLLAGDVVSGLANVKPVLLSEPLSATVDAVYLSSYVLIGAAALHWAMAEIALPVPILDHRVGRKRLLTLALATLAAPAAIPAVMYTGSKGVENSQIIVIGLGSAVLFLLVIARLAGLLRVNEEAAARESVLRRAGAALVGATSRDGICEAAQAAAMSLLETVPGGHAWLTIGSADDATVIGPGAVIVGEDELRLVSALHRTGVAATGSELTQDGIYVIAAPLMIQREVRGAVIAIAPRPLPAAVKDGLQTLSSQIALALESSQLTEDLLLRRSEERFGALVQNSSDVITLVDADLTIRYQTPSVEAVLGYGADELVGLKLGEIIHSEDAPRTIAFLLEVAAQPGVHTPIEFRVRRRDGSWCHVETVTNNMLEEPTVTGIVLTSRDVTERKTLERQLTHQAFHDSLTNLANRALFTDRLQHALARNRGRGRPVAVLFVDLDDFKTVNDSLGHTAGDDLLTAVAKRLRGCLRPGDTCARLGGDEFALLLEDVPDEAQARRVAERVANVLRPSISLQDKEVFVRASIGIAMGDGLAGGSDDLLRAADIAMYRAKSQGKGNYAVYEPSMHTAAVERLELKAELQRAVAGSEFVLEYQPIIRLRDRRITAVEALVRWDHPTRGLLQPNDFIGLAEETGLIIPLGRWVLEQACRQGKEWADRWHDIPLRMSVNLSGRQLQDPGLLADVRAALSASGLDPGLLVLEITESVLMQDSDATSNRLKELKGLGLRLAIDDFGTGYSSLSYLKRFSVDILKIAKPFIDGLNSGGREEAQLARAIVRLGETLGLETVAEGIEAAEQHELLAELGCGLGQGFHFARPLAHEQVAHLLGASAKLGSLDDEGGGKVIAFPGAS